MKSRNEATRLGRERESAFWAAATLAVPVLLSAALLLVLLLEMAVAALGVGHQVSRVIGVAIVELCLAGGFIWSTRKSRPCAEGVGVAGAIIGVILFAGAAATL